MALGIICLALYTELSRRCITIVTGPITDLIQDTITTMVVAQTALVSVFGWMVLVSATLSPVVADVVINGQRFGCFFVMTSGRQVCRPGFFQPAICSSCDRGAEVCR